MAQGRVYGHEGASCKKCEKLGSKDYAKGIKVVIKDIYDCENCVVYQTRPSADNVVIVDLYADLPLSFDYYGNQRIFIGDVIALMALREIEKDLYEDYYNRVVFLHNTIVGLLNEKREKKFKTAEAKKAADKRQEQVYKG